MQVFAIQARPRGEQRQRDRNRIVSAVKLDARPLGAPAQRQIVRWRAAVERDRDLKRAGRVVIAPMYAQVLLAIDRDVGLVACDELTDRLSKFLDAHLWRGITGVDVAAWLNAGFVDLLARGFLSRVDDGFALTWPHDHELWDSEVRGRA